MNKLLPIIVAVVSAGGLAATACTVNSTTNNNGDDGGGADSATTGDDGGNTDTGTETDSGTITTEAAAEAAAPVTNVRLANWSPDGPAAGYDFCVAPHGTTTWSGPQLAQVIGDAGTLSLAFPNVTTYFEIDPGQYDIEIVQAAAADCTAPVGAAITNLPSMAQNNFYTIAFVGDSASPPPGTDPALTAIGFQDDPAPTGGTVNVRFLNAAPGLNGTTTVDFGTGALGASTFAPLETSVAFGQLASSATSDAGAVDTNGYVSEPAFTSATEFSAHTTTGGNSDTATASGVMIPASSSATLVLINGKTGAAAASFLVCQSDTVESTTGLLSACTQVAH
jgi:hypothetical protein